MTRTSTLTASEAPTGRTSPSWRTRSSATWDSSGSSAISSRKRVPPLARRTRPSRSSLAPENAPRRWPNSSLSMRLRGSAPQLIGTNAPRRPEASWIARAISSLPVPVSPRIRTATLARAILVSWSMRCSSSRLTVRNGIGVVVSAARSRSESASCGSPSSRNMSRVPPASMTSPSVSVVTRAGSPLTRMPFFEPRSAASQPAGWVAADLGSKNGILVNGDPARVTTLTDGDVIEAGGTLLMFREDGDPHDADSDRDLAAETTTPIPFRTVSRELEHRIDQLTKIARASVAVLIRGETGTGKELIARAIHDASGRRGAFVPINCGALPRNLIESELFGHRRGAFSGASEERDGLVRRANGGTLFLDEIAELPEESQVALLRVLQEGEVRPVGASDTIKVDVRVVAATHQDLQARISDGRFRQDLYARLSGFEVSLPPLRDRREDLGSLISTILPRIATHPHRITLHRSAARLLLRYGWPLNIRELEQALRAAVALAEDGEIRAEHLSCL